MFDGFCRHALISGKNKDVLFQKIVDRLEAGAAEYGDDSFRRDHAELLREIEEEAFDIFGWMFIYIQSVGVTSWDHSNATPNNANSSQTVDMLVQQKSLHQQNTYLFSLLTPTILTINSVT